MINKKELAEHAIHVEQNVAKECVGIQDQILASYGGLQVIEMGPGNKFNVSPLILPENYKQQLESHIMLGFSGVQRFSSDAASQQVQNIKNKKNFSQMKEIHAIAQEAYSLLKENKDFAELGKLFDATWKLKRTLTNIMSNETIDIVYEKAISLGAYGGRLMGAGNGGFLMLFAPPEAHYLIQQELKEIKVWVPFKFENTGSQIVFYDEH